MIFTYLTGEEVKDGDIVNAANQLAFIEKIINPETQDAKDFNCEKIGGLLIRFESGDLQLWPLPDEDLKLIKRC